MSSPSHHASSSNSFRNPWPPLRTLSNSALSLLKFPLERVPTHEKEGESIPDIRTVPLDLSLYQTSLTDHVDEEKRQLRTTWLGHAGFLVEIISGGRCVRILLDPIFSDRASPSASFGPKRRLPPPCAIGELPEVGFVVLSHNHYDHLDASVLESIHTRFPSSIHYLVPLGVKALLLDFGLPSERIHELDWWDTVDLDGTEFVCTPAQHNSGRGILDQSATLWASWVVRRQSHTRSGNSSVSVWFAGDTGYQTADGPCPAFQEIGERYGPFDVGLIPIWRGATLSFLGKMGLRLSDDSILATLHATPEDAVCIQHSVRARHALGMHFATFAGSADEAREPLVRLNRAIRTYRQARDHREGSENTNDVERHDDETVLLEGHIVERGLVDVREQSWLDWKMEGGMGVIDIGETVDIPLGKLDEGNRRS